MLNCLSMHAGSYYRIRNIEMRDGRYNMAESREASSYTIGSVVLELYTVRKEKELCLFFSGQKPSI